MLQKCLSTGSFIQTFSRSKTSFNCSSHGVLQQNEMNNWIGPTVKQLWNYAMHVLQIFFGISIYATAFCFSQSAFISYNSRSILTKILSKYHLEISENWHLVALGRQKNRKRENAFFNRPFLQNNLLILNYGKQNFPQKNYILLTNGQY